MRLLLAALTAFLIAVACYATAFAQGGSVIQSGPISRGHVGMWSTNGVQSDAGPAAAGNIKELGITNTGLPFCINSAPITGPYYQLCLGAAANGATMITSNAYGGATPQALNFNINNQNYNFPGNGMGNILGPNSSCVGCLAYFNNTAGTLAASLPSLTLTQSGFPSPTHGFTIDITSTLSGTYTGGPTTANFLHTINTGVNNGNSNFTSTLLIDHEFGGSSVIGGQNALEVDGYFDKGATSSTNGNRNYVGGFLQMVALNGDGGTDPSSLNTTKGAIFGVGTFGDAKIGTAFTNVSGGEINVAAETGTTVAIKTGLQIVDHALDAVHGTLVDAALSIGAQPGAVKFQNAFLLSDDNGIAPLTTTACVICTTPNNESIATGIDLSQYNITGFFLKSVGFYVTGAGDINGIALMLTGANPGPTFLPSQSAGGFISSNFTNGGSEVDFFNLVNSASGFNFYQKTGASTGTLIATLNGGTIILPGMATSTPCGSSPAGTLWNSGGTVHVC